MIAPQLHYPRPSFRADGEHQVRIQPDGSFAEITICDNPLTFLFIEEADLDRLMRACASAKGLFAGHRYQQQHQEES